MNQILYKGYTFGGVGEDVTNKQHTITLDGQGLETIGGENSEVFNNYKGQNINIAEGKGSTVIGEKNRELKYIKENGQYIRPDSLASKLEYNFISGFNNLILTGKNSLITGYDNISQSDDGSFISGCNNKTKGTKQCAVIGEYNQVEYDHWTPLQNLICGSYNTSKGDVYSGIFGYLNDSNSCSYSLIAGTKNKAINCSHNYYGGVFIFGGYNDADNMLGTLITGYNNIADGGSNDLIYGYSNTVSAANYSLVGGLSNWTNSDYSIIGGGENNIKGNFTLVCGRRNDIDDAPYSLITGEDAGVRSALNSIIIGESINPSAEKTDNSIEANAVHSSILQGKNIRIGHFNKKIGITTDITTSPISLMTGYTTEQRSYGGVFNGYLIYNEYNSYTKDEDTIYYIINTKYFYREGGYTWNISDYPPSGFTYLGTTITNISEGSTQHDFSIITSVEYNATISSFEDYDILQICNSTNYSLENRYYYLNSQWNEQTYEFGPFDAYNCLISGVNIEARGGLKSCEIFGDNQVISAAYTSANGTGNDISGQYVNINGGNNTISGFQMTCYGSQNNISGSNVLNIGDSNSFGGSYLYNIGSSNTIMGIKMFCIGHSNTLTSGPDSYNIGSGNSIDRAYLFNIGEGLTTTNNRIANADKLTLNLGCYNNSIDKLLILGNGTTDNNRSNALEIDYDGSQIITLKDTTVTGLGIGKITINQQNIIFESLKENSSQVKETVEFTFEDLKLVKQISQLPNLDNNSYPIPI